MYGFFPAHGVLMHRNVLRGSLFAQIKNSSTCTLICFLCCQEPRTSPFKTTAGGGGVKSFFPCVEIVSLTREIISAGSHDSIGSYNACPFFFVLKYIHTSIQYQITKSKSSRPKIYILSKRNLQPLKVKAKIPTYLD
jgi:hypothetical protein